MKPIYPIILLLTQLLFVPIISIIPINTVNAQQPTNIIDVTYVGTCKDFNVTLTTATILGGCWDAKMDVTGEGHEIFDPITRQWKDSFYYVENSICAPKTSAIMQIRLGNIDSAVPITAKLRQDSKMIEKPFQIQQDCPIPFDNNDLGYHITAILLIFVGFVLVWWWKGRRIRRKKKRTK